MPGLFDLLSDPMVGMQLMANSGPSVGAPRGLFDGVPEIAHRQQKMAMAQQQRELEAQRRAQLVQGLQASPMFNDISPALIDANPDFALKMAQSQQPKEHKPNSPMGKIMADLNAGLITQDQANQAIAGVGKPGVQVNLNPGQPPSDAALRKELMKGEGELWGQYLKSGNQASAMQGDMELLDVLSQSAPQGPLQGRLAEMFPGFNSAGDAFNAIVKRLAPTMRVEGSGSTSDIEVEMMVRSLPNLRNSPQANKAIIAMFQRKSEINMQRAQIAEAYQNGQMTAVQARQAISELNKQSIMTPELQSALSGLEEQGATEAPQNVPQEDWDMLTPEERALWN